MEKRIMDDQTRRKLLGLLPFAKGASLPFTPEAFQKVEEATLRPVFLIGPYDQQDRDRMAGRVRSGTFDKAVIAEAMENSGVRGWSSFYSLPDGEEIPSGTKGILIDLPDGPFYELHQKITELTIGPSEIEKEVLESPQPSTSAQ